MISLVPHSVRRTKRLAILIVQRVNLPFSLDPSQKVIAPLLFKLGEKRLFVSYPSLVCAARDLWVCQSAKKLKWCGTCSTINYRAPKSVIVREGTIVLKTIEKKWVNMYYIYPII